MDLTGEAPSKTRSRLLEKLHKAGLTLPLDLERLALARGCDYYQRDIHADLPLRDQIPLSNAELAIALISPSLLPGAREIRLAAALLGSSGIRPEEVAALAKEENCVGVVRHIASAGRQFEPENQFWSELLQLLPNVYFDTDALPHPTRFVEMTGIDRGKIGVFTRWIRPRQPAVT
jgi:hypothetical protein